MDRSEGNPRKTEESRATRQETTNRTDEPTMPRSALRTATHMVPHDHSAGAITAVSSTPIALRDLEPASPRFGLPSRATSRTYMLVDHLVGLVSSCSA
jgi:hypothetical protein